MAEWRTVKTVKPGEAFIGEDGQQAVKTAEGFFALPGGRQLWYPDGNFLVQLMSSYRDEELIEAALEVVNKFDVAADCPKTTEEAELESVVNHLRKELVRRSRMPNHTAPLCNYWEGPNE